MGNVSIYLLASYFFYHDCRSTFHIILIGLRHFFIFNKKVYHLSSKSKNKKAYYFQAKKRKNNKVRSPYDA